MKHWLWQRCYNWQRHQARKQATGTLADFLNHPLPERKTTCAQLQFAALDFETTGLDPARDKLLSFGLVPFDFQGIPVQLSRHQLIQSPSKIPEQSAILHGITDDTSATGAGVQSALDELLLALRGRILITHHGKIELGFLNQLCQRLYNASFVCLNIDTEQLARRYLNKSNSPIRANDLRLYNLRERFNLPRYKAHNALSDALATAELFLALSTSFTVHRRCRLQDFL